MRPDVRDKIIFLSREIGEANIALLKDEKGRMNDEKKRITFYSHILVNLEIQKRLDEISKFIAQKIYNQYPNETAQNAIEYVKDPNELQKDYISSLKSAIAKDCR